MNTLISTEQFQLLKQVWRLSLPVLITNLLQSLVSVVDVFMVGRLGPIPIAAVGMGTVIRTLVVVMVLSVAAGAMSLIAQAKGARDPERMSFVTRQAISSGFLLSLVLLVVGLATARPLLQLANSGGDPEAVRLGTAYLQILFLGMPFLVLNVVFDRLMQGAGDTMTPLILNGALNLLNIGFNYIFMFGLGFIPAYGLQGAAIGTVIARGLGLVLAFLIIYSGKNIVKILPGSYRPDWQMFRDIFAIGVPSGIQGIFRNGSRLLVISIITSTEAGTYGAAALAIGLQVESLAFMPVLGINVAATSLVGQSLGSWQTEEARRRGNTAVYLGVALMIVLITPLVAFAPAIIRLFDPSAHPVLLQTGTLYMRINTVFLPFSAVAMVANGALRGAGDSTPGMMSTILTRAAGSVTLAYLLGIVLGYGSTGVWWALALGMVGEAVYMAWRWRGDVWLEVALHKTDLYRQHLHHLPAAVQEQFLREVRAPLMARPFTLEQVNETGVVYQTADHTVTVHFSAEGYEMVTAVAL
ncbi:MAG: MATE family efflux transporter [Ardenticatenaceae bacterium]|nr:MATE family efflux transporter [Ardenticatenaceae bacterium]